MPEPQTKVSITGYQFSLTDLEDFIAHSRRVETIAHDADVYISVDADHGSPYVTLYTRTDD
jgi:hypothetical protein